MVAKVISGKSIAGVLRYNERKVQKGHATLLGAEKFGSDGTDLSFSEKYQRFALLTRTNKKAKTNAVHISLNFSPEDLLHPDKLRDIAQAYMEGIGFGEQPYLLYEHFDAAHPHIHIVSTNIQEDGTRIKTHNIGREKSEPTRQAIEQTFALIPAQSRKRNEPYQISPIDLQRIRYGQVETKGAISSVVREVVRSYRFTSLDEYRAALEQYGVTVEGGKPGSRLYDKRGIIYSVIDEVGQRVGVPIKASDMYSKPTLTRLEARFTLARVAKQGYRSRLQQTIDRLMAGALRPQSVQELVAALAEKKIHVVVKRNEHGQVSDITYVDNLAKVVFAGAELGEAYSVAGMQGRMIAPPTKDHQDAVSNQVFVAEVLAQTDFSKELPQVIAGWMLQGMVVRARTSADGHTRYWLGRRGSRLITMTEADTPISAWLRANRVSELQTASLTQQIAQRYPQGIPAASPTSAGQLLKGLDQLAGQVLRIILSIICDIIRPTHGRSYVPYQLLQSSQKKKRNIKKGRSPQ